MPENTDQQAGTGTQTPEAPPWGTDEQFDPQKAWNLIQGLKSDKEKLAKRPVLTDDAAAKLAQFEKLEQDSKTELQRKTEELTRWQTDAEKWRTTAVGARIEALAGQDFADPSDAASALNPADYLDAGGVIDETRIKADLAAVLDKKPHWRRAGVQSPRVPAPNSAQGTSSNGPAVVGPADAFAAIFKQKLA